MSDSTRERVKAIVEKVTVAHERMVRCEIALTGYRMHTRARDEYDAALGRAVREILELIKVEARP